MSKASKSELIRNLIIIGAFLNISVSFWLEWMPQSIKNGLNTMSQHLGISDQVIWIAGTILLAAATLIIVRTINKAKQMEEPAPEENSKPDKITKKKKTKRQVTQGEKSVYIEKNKGDINVR